MDTPVHAVPGPTVLSLPIADRRRSAAFYRALLGAEPFGAPADDGVPEPLQFTVGTGLTLMLVPAGGFGWVIGDDREVAGKGQHELVASLAVAREVDVAEVLGRARDAGGTIVREPADLGWGHHGLVGDPDGHLWMITVAA
jgi:uncharacterized protein